MDAGVLSLPLETEDPIVADHLRERADEVLGAINDEGPFTDFQSILSGVRRRLATEWVDDAGSSLTEIAFLLGYSDTRAFRRAYKAWFGKTPRGGDTVPELEIGA